MKQLHEHARTMISTIIADNLPQKSVESTLKAQDFTNTKVYIIAIGKAAWTMTKTASDYLGNKVEKGILITKYGHSNGKIPKVEIYEAGHPTPDENTVKATKAVLALAENLNANDLVLFLVSGGGSALFEAPQDGISLEDMAKITNDLLASGADITEINTIRKRLSKVKGGRFADICKPASILSIVLSDVLGDRLDIIASGPAAPDKTTKEETLRIIEKYGLKFTQSQMEHIHKETPKSTNNVKTFVTGSVRSLCESAAVCAKSFGFNPYILTSSLNCEASQAGKFLAAIARDTQEGHTHFQKPCAIIAGGETVVRVTGDGKGGRNQELALAAAAGIAGIKDVVIFSLGSDGTDGPTDAAGGIVDGDTCAKLAGQEINIDFVLGNNDSYNGLKAVDGLIITGPTGTNVNDVSVALII